MSKLVEVYKIDFELGMVSLVESNGKRTRNDEEFEFVVSISLGQSEILRSNKVIEQVFD